MAPIIRYGTVSSSDAEPWTCECGKVNLPTRFLLFKLPKFSCECGEKFTGDFRCSFDDIKVNGHYLLGKVHNQGTRTHCVAYAYTHALQFKERLEAVIMKQDPSLLKDLDPEKLFYMYTKRCPEMNEKDSSIKRRNNRMVHIALILKEVGLPDENPESSNPHKVGDVTVIPRDDFEMISTAIANGEALVGTFFSGKRLRDLKYGQIYRSYRAPKYRGNKNKKIVGHAVCLIGAGRESGVQYHDFVNSYQLFCVRRNSRGKILKSGIGRLHASDLKSNVVRFSRVAVSGEESCSLQPQSETRLNAWNRRLMTALKPRVADQPDIDDEMDVEDSDSYMDAPHDATPAETKAYTSRKWLSDEKSRGQFLVFAGTVGEVYWNDAEQAMSELVYQKQYCTSSFIQWSPLGTYLITVDRQGAQVWGGDDKFVRLMHFAHQQVKLVDLSPGERYLVTYSSHELSNPRETHMVLNIFDVRTGKLMLDFKENVDEFTTGRSVSVSDISWFILRWGGGRDDRYFAKLGKNDISVYETEKFSLLDKKSLKLDNVADFSWSPTGPILCLFVPELDGGNQPARVTLVRIPDGEVLWQKNLYSVCDFKMHWQGDGEYLVVQVERYTKAKNKTYTGFELFSIKKRDLPIEVFELDNKNEKIIAFAWEPRGCRFAVIHGDGPKADVSFYTVRTDNNVSCVAKLTTLKAKQTNALFWSPAGCFIVLAGLDGVNGKMEFYNVDDLETMAMAEHLMVTDVMWDPTGRFLATAVTSSVHQKGNGFQIWSCDGKQLYKVSKDHLYQFHWRPRPPSLLGPEKEISTEPHGKEQEVSQEPAERAGARGGATEAEGCHRRRRRRKSIKLRWLKWLW